VYILSAALMIVLAIALRLILPTRLPHTSLRYGQLLASMGHLALHTRLLQRRAIYQACMFGAFSLFWTTTPLLLASPAFDLSQNGIALFALAGAAGAVASPIAGRLADRGFSMWATAFAMLLGTGAFLLAHFSGSGSTLALAMLTLSGVLLDFGVQTNLVIGQRSIYALSAAHRSRLNGLYMATFFCGGAFGSPIGGWAYASGGWSLTSWIGVCFPVVALVIFATERPAKA
jgi:predicted MFS family arabinose efflux permease